MQSEKLLEDLFLAYYDARKNKRNTASALKFELEYEKNLFALFEEIKNYRYEIGPSTCFMVKKPVQREIFAANFRDRIVHHLVFNYINPIFEKHFIRDSYSCRIGKGTSFGIERVDHFIRSCSENYQKDCWILKLDIEGYFMAMDRNILFEKIEKKLNSAIVETRQCYVSTDLDKDLILYLIKKIIFNDPTKNCRVKGKREDWVGLPKSKSLFFAKKDRGFPIGNLTSQLFGNIYLDDFDHFVKEKLHIKCYGRYVDDMVFVHGNREYLKKSISWIKFYLQAELRLVLHPKKIYFQNCFKGVKFLGVYVLPYRIYIDKRTKKNFYDKIKYWNEFIENSAVETPRQGGASLQQDLGGGAYRKKFIASMNSYLGIMAHYKTHKLRKKMLTRTLSQNFIGQVSVAEDYAKVEPSRHFIQAHAKNVKNLDV